LVKLEVLIVDPKGRLHTEPVLKSIFNRHTWLSQFVQLRQDWTGKHVLYLDFAGALGVKEEKEFANRCDDIEGVEWLCQLL